MATNIANRKPVGKQAATKLTATPNSQPSAALKSKSKSKPLLNALADKENIQLRQESQSGPVYSGQTTPSLADPESAASHKASANLAAALLRVEEMEGRLLKEQKEKQQLQADIEALRAKERGEDEEEADTPPSEDIVPRPVGTSGKDWSLQIEMGLSGSQTKDAKYAALLRGMRDLVLNSGMKWEDGWKEIPAAVRGKLFQVARERYPILRRYANDWATIEMVKQYLKNKRGHHYKNGWLEVPEKYAYLKQNASKRNPIGSRVKRAKVEMAAKRKRKHQESLAAVGKGKGKAEMDMEDSEEEGSSGEGRSNE